MPGMGARRIWAVLGTRSLSCPYILLFLFPYRLPDSRFGRISEEVVRDEKNRTQPDLIRIIYIQFIRRPKTRTTPKTAPPIMEVTNNAQMQTSTISFEVAGGRAVLNLPIHLF